MLKNIKHFLKSLYSINLILLLNTLAFFTLIICIIYLHVYICLKTSLRKLYLLCRVCWNSKHFNIIFNRSFLFVCLGFLVILENLSLIWRRRHCRWRAANFNLYSALIVIVKWGIFSVSHLLWQGASSYHRHLQWPVTFTPIAERLPVDLSLSEFEHPTFHLWGERANQLRHHSEHKYNWKTQTNSNQSKLDQ